MAEKCPLLKKAKLDSINPKIFHVKHDKLSTPFGLHITQSESRIAGITRERSKHNLKMKRSRSNLNTEKTSRGSKLSSSPSVESGISTTSSSDSAKNRRTTAKVVSPFYRSGCLLNFLSQEPITVLEAVALSNQIVQGMRYLEYQGIVHGRLSCRNILIKERNSGSLVLVDFGLGDTSLCYPPFNLPARNQNNKNSSKIDHKAFGINTNSEYSTTNIDIWAFGMTLLEIFNGGVAPFNSLGEDVILEKLANGIRPGRPDDCPPCIYELALRCLVTNSEQRPSFGQLSVAFDTIYLAITTPNFEWRDEIFGLPDNEDIESNSSNSSQDLSNLDNLNLDENPIDIFKKKAVRSNYENQTFVKIIMDPKTKSNILTEEQMKQLKEFTLPGCTKPYPAKTDLVWLQLENKENSTKSYGLVASSDTEEGLKEFGLVSFFKHQVGIFDFNHELWSLIRNPEQELIQRNASAESSPYSNLSDSTENNSISADLRCRQYTNNCTPLYPMVADKETGRIYTVSPNKQGILVKTLDIFDSSWHFTQTSLNFPEFSVPVPGCAGFGFDFADLTAFDIVTFKNKIYLNGGYNSENNTVYSALISYDTFTKKWSVLPDMPRPRMFHKCVVIDDSIYVTGGCTLSGQEKSEFRNDSLSCLKGFIHASSTSLSLARMVFQDKSTNVAQSNKPRDYEVVDKFDIESNTWKELSLPENNDYAFVRRRRHGIGGFELKNHLPCFIFFSFLKT